MVTLCGLDDAAHCSLLVRAVDHAHAVIVRVVVMTNDIHHFLPSFAHPAVGSPLEREGVAFFPVYAPGCDAPVLPILTGPEAPVSISELPMASVPTLVAENGSNDLVLLVDGQTVVGGHQNRVLNVSVLVPGGRRIEVPVSCVEAGRWNGGGGFRSGRSFATRRVRRTTVASVGRNVRESGSKRSDQGAVWGTIDHELRRLAVSTDSSALSAIDTRLEAGVDDAARRIAAATDEIVRRGPLPGQRGVVISHGSRVVSFECFASTDLLAQHWEAIVRSAMLDAPERRPSSRPSATRALEFVRKAATHAATASEGVGAGREHHLRTSRVVGQALVLDGLVVHASAFALAA